MTPEKIEEIEKTDLALQSAFEKAVAELNGKEMGLIELFKHSCAVYGADSPAGRRKVAQASNIADLLDMFVRDTFKSPEQRAAEKAAAEAATRAEEDQFLAQYLYDKEIGGDVTDRQSRAEEIAALRKAEKATPQKKEA